MKQIPLLYETLLAHYGNLHWWPAKTPYEIIVGAVLTQNTAWNNVEKAIANFGDRLLPEFILKVSLDELSEIIRPAGFLNQKAVYLKTVTEWYKGYSFDVKAVRNESPLKIRMELLSLKGIGKETADSILLYAFRFPTFVVDAYTVRLCERFPIDIEKSYDSIKAYFENNLTKSEEIYNNYHALIVINGKEHCKKKPSCEGCPLAHICERRGI